MADNLITEPEEGGGVTGGGGSETPSTDLTFSDAEGETIVHDPSDMGDPGPDANHVDFSDAEGETIEVPPPNPNEPSSIVIPPNPGDTIGPDPDSIQEREEREQEAVREREEGQSFDPPHSPHGAEQEFDTDRTEVADPFVQQPVP